jgi:phosphotransferase system HPr (HPr) family protein
MPDQSSAPLWYLASPSVHRLQDHCRSMATAIMDSSTVSREVTVGLEEGLHLTPLRSLTLLAEKFTCEIFILKGDRKVDAKSMLDLMTLMAEHGTQLVLSAQGPDAAAAIQALGELFDNNFRPNDQC